MLKSSRFGLYYLAQHQVSKDILLNDNFDKIDTLMWCSFKDVDLQQPPQNINKGDAYIVPVGAIGQWEQKDNCLAFYRGNTVGWEYYSPKVGYSFYISSKNSYYAFNGVNWFESITSTFTPPDDGIHNLSMLGVNSNATAYNKLSVNSENVLFHSAEKANLQISSGDASKASSISFSNNFVTKATIGVLGDNNLHFNTSSDGQNFLSGMLIQQSGQVSLQNGCYLKGGLQFEGSNHVLSDYKTGYWTPTINSSQNGNGPNNYFYQNGSFVKVGRLVFVNIFLECNGLSGSGGVFISGLPYKPDSSSLFFGSANISGVKNLAQGNIANLIGITDQTTRIHLWYTNNTGSYNLLPTNIGSYFSVKGSLTYSTN
ncbi:MAG: DUF2793 domain-containing protein [Alphaproteobacteria bacterium]|nr:DUF2793 domain-containing protein [Rickettsiales bacterium]